MTSIRSELGFHRLGGPALVRKAGPLALTGPLLLAGCGAVVSVGALAAAAILTGLFLGSLQASLNATARSYALADSGPVQFNFGQPQQSQPILLNFTGRLPAFHIVFIDIDDKSLVRSQSSAAIEYETDVQLDFSSNPPAISGTVRERGGDQQFDILELYPNLSVAIGPLERDVYGRWNIALQFTGDASNGTQLDYRITMRADLSQDGRGLTGHVTVRRVIRVDGVETDVIEGNGMVDAEKMGDDPAPDRPDDSDAGDNPDDGGDAGAGEPPDPMDDNEPPTDIAPSACFPGLDVLAADAIDLFVANGGPDSLDRNGDGTVLAEEVEETLNPVLAPFGLIVPDAAAACVAELLAGR